MKTLLLALSLTSAAAFGQAMSCEERCTSNDGCFNACSDERCMARCQSRAQSCVQSCAQKSKGGDTSKMQAQAKKGMCPGPKGRMVPCSQSAFDPAEAQADIQKRLNAPPKKDKVDKVITTMPTAENYQEFAK